MEYVIELSEDKHELIKMAAAAGVGDWVYRVVAKGKPLEPKKGHWIDKQSLFESCSAECSSCHKRLNGYLHDNGYSLECKYYDFCPNCGSDNREVEE